jgi:hypothetical protein
MAVESVCPTAEVRSAAGTQRKNPLEAVRLKGEGIRLGKLNVRHISASTK